MEKTDLEVMNEMVKTNNKGIRASTSITVMNLKKKHGEITHKLSKQAVFGKITDYAILYIINKEEFDLLKFKKQNDDKLV
jgi:hypothetical protein